MGTYRTKVAKKLSNTYSQKFLDTAKKSTADAIKTASKRATQKTAEATGDKIGNKVADKITTVSNKKSAKKLHKNDETEEGVEITTHKKDTCHQKKNKTLLMNWGYYLKKMHITRNYRWINAKVKKDIYTYISTKENKLLIN